MKGLQFRLYTENINTYLIISRARKMGIDNFTHYQANGMFDKISEHSLIIEHITPINNGNDIDKTRQIFRDLADWIKMISQQDTVLLTEQRVDFELY